MRTVNSMIGLLVAVLVVAAVGPALAQTNAGTDFWLAETPNFSSGDFAISVANPSATPATVTITNPLIAPVMMTILPGGLQTQPFSPHYNGSSGTFTDMVYHVTSNVDVVVYIFNPLANEFTNDASLVIPVNGLGKKYWIISYYNVNGNYANEFLGVVATQNGTTVSVYDQLNVLQTTVTINQGQYYQFVAAFNQDITGWRVETSVAAGVFAGNQCTSAGNSTGACDHIEEMLIPAEALANTYIGSPTLSRPVGCSGSGCSEDIFRYLSTVNGTIITTSPNVGGGTFNAGQFIEITTDVPHIVSANNPIVGMQFLVSQDSGTPAAGTGDPSMLDMPPVEQFQFNYIFLTPTTFAFDFINVVKPTTGTISLDGVGINPPCTGVGSIAGVPYCSFRVQVADGVHSITGNLAFGLSVSGFDDFASYAYIGGVGLQPINAGCNTGGPYSINTNTLVLAGVASCSDLSTPTTLWSSNDGVTFLDPTNLGTTATMPGSAGIFEICLTVSCVGADPLTCCSNVTVDALPNSPPNCDAGAAIVAQCDGVTLAGTASDPDNDPLVFSWSSSCPGTVFTPNNTVLSPGISLGSNCNRNCTLTLNVTDNISPACVDTVSVIVNDTTNPVINPPASNLSVECDGAGNAAALTAWLNSRGGANATDNCGGVTWTNNFTGLSDLCGATGAATVTFTATDGCGRSASTTATFTIGDTIPPTITTPAANQTVECDGAGNGADLTAWLNSRGGAVATDACSGANGVTWSNNFTSLSDLCGATGAATVTFTATDACGLTSTTTATFTIRDTTPPPITTPAADQTVECDGAGNGAALTAWLNSRGGAVATDACSGANGVTWSNNFTSLSDLCGATGAATVIFTATDACGLTSTTTATFTIRDTTPPPITTPAADQTVECDGAGNGAALTAWLNSQGGAVATDTCSGANGVTWSNNFTNLSDLCGATGAATVTFTATDACGLTSTTTATFTIRDTTPPVLHDTGVDDTIECSEAIPPEPVVTASDDCSSTTLTLDVVSTQDPDPASCGHYDYTITRTWTAVDDCDLSTTAIQVITVRDTTAPVLVGGVLAPQPAAPASSAASVCSPASSGGFRVVCSGVTDNCDDTPSTTAQIVVTNYDVVNGVCVAREESFDVACDEVIEIRLAAAPCPASSMAAPVPAQSAHSGVQIFTGVGVVLYETSTDACGNRSEATFDPTSSGDSCPPLEGPAGECTEPCSSAGVVSPEESRKDASAGSNVQAASSDGDWRDRSSGTNR